MSPIATGTFQPAPSGPVAGNRQAANQSLRWNLFSTPDSPEVRVLTSDTHHWLRRMPRSHHPKSLCLQFPWVGNRLAQVWHDPALTEWFLSDLVVDLSRSTAANCARIQMEVRRIRALHGQRRSERLVQRTCQ